MKILFSISVLFSTLILFAQQNTQTNIDTNQVIDFKKVNIAGATLRATRPGISSGVYKTAIKNGVLYVGNKVNKVLPYIILRYEFSYMNKDNKYKTIACVGNLLNDLVFNAAQQMQKFTTADIDKVYAIKINTST